VIVRVALRSLTVRPVRSAVLAAGFGLGVSVMAALLGVGAVILEQARTPALAGGGDVVIGSPAGLIANGPFVLYTLRPGGPFGDAVRALSPSRTDTLYLRHDGRAVPIRVRAGVPSAERAFGDVETSGVPGWTDTPADRRWAEPDAGAVLRSIDRFHAIPDAPGRASSWAEWLYFNGSSKDARFYLTFLAGPQSAPGRRGAGVRLQLDRGGVVTAYASRTEVDERALLAHAPDLTFGENRVELVGTDYRITLDLPAENGPGRVRGTIVVHGNPDRSVPPFVLQGANGWVSGYTVPVMAGALDGGLDAAGRTIDFTGGTAYHDHNWGFWEGVSWQWGQVQHDGLSFVYGRVYPPADAADPGRLPGFLAVLGPSGPLAFSTDATIEESNTANHGRPDRITVRAASPSLEAFLDLAIDQTTATRMQPGSVGDGLEFLQLRAMYTVRARVGDQRVEFTAPGSAETFRGADR
jgi:hypothetical protein